MCVGESMPACFIMPESVASGFAPAQVKAECRVVWCAVSPYSSIPPA
jgi:hypothetical protein